MHTLLRQCGYAILGSAAVGSCTGDQSHVPWVYASSGSMSHGEVCEPTDLTTHGNTDIKIPYAGRPPCAVFATPYITLEGSVDGSVPDPGHQLAVLESGRVVTTIDGLNGTLAVWSTAGEFMYTLGRPGHGPGEIAPRGTSLLLAGYGDTLFVLDASNRWSVFDSAGAFVRTFLGTGTGRYSGSVILAGDFILTGGGLSGAASAHSFQVADRAGVTVHSFGDIATGDVSDAFPVPARKVAAAGNGSFWALPAHGQRGGLVLERWTIDGRRERRLTYDLPWLPANGYRDPGDPQEPVLPEYEYLNVDSGGLVWIAVSVRDRRWRRTPAALRQQRAQELYDGRLLVASEESGEVLASHLYDGPEDPMPPFARMVPGTRLSYRSVRDENDRSRIEFFHLALGRVR